jgi:hypothetical protein
MRRFVAVFLLAVVLVPMRAQASPPWSVNSKWVLNDDGSRVSLVGKIRAYDAEGVDVIWTYRSRTVTPTVTQWTRESDYRTSADRGGDEFVFRFRSLPKLTENVAFRLHGDGDPHSLDRRVQVPRTRRIVRQSDRDR